VTDTAQAVSEPADTLERARDVLARCRRRVEEFEAGAARSNRALYEALETAYRLHDDLARDDKARRALMRENRVRSARRGANPFTDVVKLAFGGADRMRVNKYACVLAHVEASCPKDLSVADWLDHPDRGIENSVKAWRRNRRPGAAGAQAKPSPQEACERARALVEQAGEVDLAQCEPLVRQREAGSLVLVVARRGGDGSLAALHVADDPEGRDLDRLLTRLGGDPAWTARFFAAELDKLATRREAWRREEVDGLVRLITREERAELDKRLEEAAYRRARSHDAAGPHRRSVLSSFLRPRDAGRSASGTPSTVAEREEAAEAALKAAVTDLRTRLGGEDAFRRHVARLFDRFEVDDTRAWRELDPQLRQALGLVRGGNITEKVWDVLTPPVRARILQDALPLYEQMHQRWPEAGAPGDHTVIRDFLIEVAERRRCDGMPPDGAFAPVKHVFDAGAPQRVRRMVHAPLAGQETAQTA